MSPGPQDRDGPLQSMGAYKRWLDRYLGETFGVVPMHRISGSLSEQQIGSKGATAAGLAAHEADTSTHGSADLSQAALKNAANIFTEGQAIGEAERTLLGEGSVVFRDVIAGRKVIEAKRAGEIDERLEIKEDGDVRAGDGTTAPTNAGFRSINSIAGTPDANTFTKKQIIAPDSDTQALDLRVGTGTQAPFRVRDNADTTNLAFFSNVGKLSAAGAGFNNNRVEGVADATASGDAVSRSFGDGRYESRVTGSPQGASTGPIVSVPASTAVGVAFNHYIQPVWVPARCTVIGIRLRSGATGAGTGHSRALYSADGQTRVAVSDASITAPAANTVYDLAFTTTPTVERGLYWLRVAFNNATHTFWGGVVLRNSVVTNPGNLNLPLTFTPPTTPDGVVHPILGLY